MDMKNNVVETIENNLKALNLSGEELDRALVAELQKRRGNLGVEAGSVVEEEAGLTTLDGRKVDSGPFGVRSVRSNF